MHSFGIDFGTSNSVVAALSHDGPEVLPIGDPPAEWVRLGDFSRVLPSVFAIGGDRQPLFGWAAKQELHSISAVKRAMGAGDLVEVPGSRERYTVEKVAAYLFRFLRARVEEMAFTDLREAVVTIPANSRGLARKRTKVAAGMAGIRVRALINEPTAAALAAAYREPGERLLLVYDWGAGTLDVTLLHAVDGVFVELASKGIAHLGGVDVDHALLAHVRDRAGAAFDLLGPGDLHRVGLDVERHKIELSSGAPVTTVVVPGVPGGVDVTREDLDRLTRPIVERTLVPLRTCLTDAGLRADDVDEIVLAGGSSSLPLVREMLSGLIGDGLVADIDPLTAIAEGAAVAAGILNGELPDHDFVVGIEHALGTIVRNPDGSERFSEIVARNTKLPVEVSKHYLPSRDNQPGLRFRVVEGDPTLPLDHADNIVLATWDVPLDPPRARREAAFDAHFAYDRDGIIQVRLIDETTGRELHGARVDFAGGRDATELARIAHEVDAGFMENHVEADHPQAVPPTQPDEASDHGAPSPRPTHDEAEQAILLQRARNVVIPHLQNAAPSVAAVMEDLCNRLERSSSPQEAQTAAEQLDEALRPFTFLF